VRLGEAQIHGDPAPAVRTRLGRPPPDDAGAGLAVVEVDRRAAPVGPRRAGEVDLLALPAIGPERAVAPAERAVAGGRRVRDALEAPPRRPAVAGPFDH